MNTLKSYRYILQGLDCANCAKKIEDRIAKEEAYQEVNVNFSTSKLSFQTEKENEEEIRKEIKNLVHSVEPEVKVLEEKEIQKTNSERNYMDILRLVIGVGFYLLASYSSFDRKVKIFFLIVALVILLFRTAKKGFIQIFKNKVLDENTLITISTIGACFVDKATEGVMVIVLYEIGKILEARAVNQTRKSISDLMNIKPEYANLKQQEEIIQVDPENVQIR